MEYDQTTYYGRFMRFYHMTDPRMLFVTSQQVEEARRITISVEQRKPGFEQFLPSYAISKRQLDAILHPETQKPIFLPFRFSAFIPMNLVTLLGMLHPSQQTPVLSMFWQLINQTYNVGVNYCNGSASGGLGLRDLMAAYVAAVVASCGTSYTLNTWKQRLGPRAPSWLQIVIPYSAVALANIANVAVVRYPDLVRGIRVADAETNDPLPTPSRAAGRWAVTQVAISRILVPIPLMLLPPVLLRHLFDSGKYSFLTRNRSSLYLPVQLASIIVMLRLALPSCIAVFPQECTLPVTSLEPEFRNMKNSHGNKIENVVFNKGL